MWGSSFADLAKQAADLQEQAAKKAAELQEQAASVVENVPSANTSSFTSPVAFGGAGGFFNMDSLQENKGTKASASTEKEAPQATQSVPAPSDLTPAQAAAEAPKTPEAAAPSEVSANEERLYVTAEEEGDDDDDEDTEDDKDALERAWKERQEQKKREKAMAQAKQEAESGETVPTPSPESDQKSEEPKEDKENKDGQAEDEETNDDNVDGDSDAGDESSVEDGWSEDDIGNVTDDTDNDALSPEAIEDLVEDDIGGPQPIAVDPDDTREATPTTDESNADEPPLTTNQDPSPPSAQVSAQEQEQPTSIPDYVLDQFSKQLKRLEENHGAEKQATKARHESELQVLKQELAQTQQNLRQSQIDGQRVKEGQSLKLDALQRELTGTQELLQDKEKEFKRLQQQHLNQLRGMEKQMVKAEDETQGNVERVKVMEKQVDDANAALETSKEEYNTLKDRTKVVASELKERRSECRTLTAEVEVLKANNSSLQDQITQMQGESLDMNQNTKEKRLELHMLKTELAEKESELKEAQNSIQKAIEKGDDALSTYKKKAQQSLALANARTASAVQAREEAEMEARAARSTSDTAMERALMAEQNGKEAEVKAKLYVSKMEKEVAQYKEVKEALEMADGELEQVKKTLEASSEVNAKQTCELQSIAGRLEASQKTIQNRNKELDKSKADCTDLFQETEKLNALIHRLKDELHMLTTRMKNSDAEEKKDAFEQSQQVVLNFEAEATIAMLRQELNDANTAIRELKETLRATVEEAEASPGSAPMQPAVPANTDGATGMPLFYAMEKQAELTQARNEITRLANLLGDSESDKQNAMEATKDMQLRMNEALAKLKRQEQHEKLTPQEEQVNMEYLKNVTLSFVNATSVAEKKALLPVIGTVLCLTPEELSKATAALDNGSSAVLESVTSSVLSLGWGS